MDYNKLEFIQRHRYCAPKRCMTTPLYVHLELTQQCPVGCSQCYASLDNKNELDWSLCEDILSQMAGMKIPKILLTGGEPLFYSKLIDCIKLIKKYNIVSLMASSGFGLTENLCKELCDAGIDEIYISLNGSSEEIHNKSRNYFKFSIDAIKLIKSFNMFCGINWVARHDNVKDFTNLYDLAKLLGVNRIEILSNKKNCDGNIDSKLTKNDLLLLAQMINDVRALKEIDIVIDPCFKKLKNLLLNSKASMFDFACNAGKVFFDISAFGNLSSCRHNISEKEICMIETTLQEYWNQNEVLEKQRQNNNAYQSCQEEYPSVEL